MSKKIAIDIEEKELIIRNIEYALEGGLNPANRLLKIIDLLQGKTEIDTDQSIEERAKEHYNKPYYVNGIDLTPAYIEGYELGATEQDLISKAREKELKDNIIVCDNCKNDFFVTTIDGGKKCYKCSKPKKSDCCNAIIDTDEQSCYICTNCGERL